MRQPMQNDTGRVLAVNVGAVRQVTLRGRALTTGIWKSPVVGRVAVRGVNLAGDDQADREVHGGPDKAVYAYACEDAAWWEHELGQPVAPGTFGENLTLTGIDVTRTVVGEQWEIGTALLEVSQPRMPCWKLGARMNDPGFPRRFAAAGRPGAYLRIVREGELEAGDQVRIIRRPAHGITVGAVADIYLHDRDRASELLEAPELPEGWLGGGDRREGRHVAFAANRTDPARFDVFAQPLLGEARMLREGPGGYFMPAGWSPDGATLLAAAVHSSTNQNLYLLDVAIGESSSPLEA